MTVYDQLQRALRAEGIIGSLEHVLLTLRMHNDTAYVSVRQSSTEAEAQEWLDTEGQLFRAPVAIARVQGDETSQLPPPNIIRSSESIAGIGDGANIWRGYGRNTRGVIKFRQGRFVGEVNAPSVDDAVLVAKGLASLLAQ